MKKHGIIGITIKDLLNDFKQTCPDWDGQSDLFKRSNETDQERDAKLKDAFDHASKMLLQGKMEVNEFSKMMQQNGINVRNSIQEVLKRAKNPNYEVSLLDVYILLYCFIKKHCNDHIFVDEMPILHSKTSK